MKQEGGRTVLFTRMPPDLAIRNWIAVIFLGGVLIWGILRDINNPNSDYSGTITYIYGLTFIFFVAAFQIYIEKGYRVSYDDKAVYLRPDGVTWTLGYRAENSMRYDDIGEIVLEYGKADMRPFEYVHLWRKGWDGKERFLISRMFLKDPEVREFFRFLYSKCPENIPESVIEYMQMPDV